MVVGIECVDRGLVLVNLVVGRSASSMETGIIIKKKTWERRLTYIDIFEKRRNSALIRNQVPKGKNVLPFPRRRLTTHATPVKLWIEKCPCAQGWRAMKDICQRS